jgi:hypothetical protein
VNITEITLSGLPLLLLLSSSSLVVELHLQFGRRLRIVLAIDFELAVK